MLVGLRQRAADREAQRCRQRRRSHAGIWSGELKGRGGGGSYALGVELLVTAATGSRGW